MLLTHAELTDLLPCLQRRLALDRFFVNGSTSPPVSFLSFTRLLLFFFLCLTMILNCPAMLG